MTDRFAINAASYVALIKNEKIFLVQRTNTTYCDGWWCLPAGHIEKNETPEAAAIRECQEEAGVTVQISDMKMVYSLFRQGRGGFSRTYADYLFIASTWHGDPSNAEPTKASQGAWFPLSALPENLIAPQRHMLEDYLLGNTYSAFLEHEV